MSCGSSDQDDQSLLGVNIILLVISCSGLFVSSCFYKAAITCMILYYFSTIFPQFHRDVHSRHINLNNDPVSIVIAHDEETIFEPRSEKTGLRVFRPGETQSLFHLNAYLLIE